MSRIACLAEEVRQPPLRGQWREDKQAPQASGISSTSREAASPHPQMRPTIERQSLPLPVTQGAAWRIGAIGGDPDREMLGLIEIPLSRLSATAWRADLGSEKASAAAEAFSILATMERGSWELVPIGLDQARAFIGEHHRHSKPPRGWKFGVGLIAGGDLVGVGIASRPVARPLDDGRTIEITRVCVLELANANSKIYGALCRAAKALGYRRAISYTLADEPGSSLRAAGFAEAGRVRAGRSWHTPSRPRREASLFGDPITPQAEKIRWERQL